MLPCKDRCPGLRPGCSGLLFRVAAQRHPANAVTGCQVPAVTCCTQMVAGSGFWSPKTHLLHNCAQSTDLQTMQGKVHAGFRYLLLLTF
jgi:hypothetical protein